MYSLTLNDEERELLEEVLKETISELRMEIADTDSHDYRVELHKREDMLKAMVKRIGTTTETVTEAANR
jgi:hypothetical protein